jgi:hypothetical protein
MEAIRRSHDAYLTKKRESTMIKVTILLPIRYNNGDMIPYNDIVKAKSRIADIKGGFTCDGEVTGEYRMDDGSTSTDVCERVFVVCESALLPALRDLASEFAGVFKQESIYFEWHQVNVEFVRG